jgi:hypothetical protein
MAAAAGVFVGGAVLLGVADLRREAREIEQREEAAAAAQAEAVVANGRARLRAKAHAAAEAQKAEERRVWEEKIAAAGREFAAAWANERNWDAELWALLAEHRKRAEALGRERPAGAAPAALIEHLERLRRAAERLTANPNPRRK